ncbi:MAG: glycosyltransferase family 9 protein [Candidatus Pacebacteria bacterium]|nr:glycosyltransferase family 9 protein [Candidatus Paceibacterota bacterium]
MNILIVKPSSLGDIVHTFPAVHLVRCRYPDATIVWVVNEAYVDLVGLSPDVDEVIPFHRKDWVHPARWGEVLDFVRELRERKFDIVIDFQGLLRSACIALVTGAPRRIGFRAAREFASLLYTEKILLPANVFHAVDKNLFLVRSALEIGDNVGDDSVFPPQHDAVKQAERLLRANELTGGSAIMAIAPAARWPSKAYASDFFARVISFVADKEPGVRCWLVGTEDEIPVGDKVIQSCADCCPVNLMGAVNLPTLIELLRRSDVLLTNDTGPMHLAAALHVPVIALFGPTDPALTGPYGKGHLVFHGSCSHWPCFEKKCPVMQQTCITEVSEEEVAKSVLNSLGRHS